MFKTSLEQRLFSSQMTRRRAFLQHPKTRQCRLGSSLRLRLGIGKETLCHFFGEKNVFDLDVENVKND
jgi:hypothetical protein